MIEGEETKKKEEEEKIDDKLETNVGVSFKLKFLPEVLNFNTNLMFRVKMINNIKEKYSSLLKDKKNENFMFISFKLMNPELCEEILPEFSKLMKSVIMTGQSLNRQVNKITKFVKYDFGISKKKEIYCVFEVKEKENPFFLNFFNLAEKFVENSQRGENTFLRISLEKSFKELYAVLVEKGGNEAICNLINGSEIEFSSCIQKLLGHLIEQDYEVFKNEYFEEAFLALLLIKNLKSDIEMDKIEHKDVNFLKLNDFLSNFTKEKIDLPKTAIISKIKDFSCKYLDSQTDINANFGKIAFKIKIKINDLFLFLNEFLKI